MNPRALLVLILCLSACSTPSPAIPAPPPPRPTTAPPIPAAGDLAPYVTHACDLLPSPQAAALGLPTTAEQTTASDRGLCIWEGTPRLALQVRPTGDPLGDTYRRSNTWEVFTPLTIAGQPAALTTTTHPGTGCRIVIGIAPTQGLELDLSATAPPTDPCTQAERAAEVMVTTLRG